MEFDACQPIIQGVGSISDDKLCAPVKNSTLKWRQRLFVEEYLIDLSATRAAIRAGYSKRTAGSIGQELLKKPEIAAAIDWAMTARVEKTGITAERVLQELAAIAFASAAEFFTPDGALRPLREIDQPTWRAIQAFELKVEAHGDNGASTRATYKIRLHRKLRALELLGKHLGLFNAKAPSLPQAEDALMGLLREAQGTTLKPKD